MTSDPVLMPPWTTAPRPKRAVSVTSIPLKTSLCVPNSDARLTTLSTWPNFVGVMS